MKKNIIIAILVLLVLLVLGMGGYLVYDKVIDSDEKESSNKTQTSEKKEQSFDLEKAKKLVDDVTVNGPFIGNSFKNYTEGIKAYASISKIEDSKFTEMSCNELYDGNTKANGIGSYYLIKDSNINNSYCETKAKTIGYDEVNSIFKNLYGTDIGKHSYSSSCYAVDYNEDKNIFVLLESPCGGAGYYIYAYDVKDVKLNNNKLTVNVLYSMFNYQPMNPDSDSYIYIRVNNQDLQWKIDEIKDQDGSFDAFKKDYISKYKDYMDIYEYSFTKNGDNYSLDNIVKK